MWGKVAWPALLLVAIAMVPCSTANERAHIHPPLPEDDAAPRRELLTSASIASVASVRLASGRSPYEGRVEVQLGGRWGSVCAGGFTAREAKVACAQAGLTGGAVRSFGRSALPALVSNMRCKGSEASLAFCRFSTGQVCNGGNVAGIVCKAPAVVAVRLAEASPNFPPYYQSPSPDSIGESGGRLEVQLSGGRWATVCDTGFSDLEAQVACRMLGLVGGRAVKGGSYGPGTHPVVLDRVQCKGYEGSLTACKYSTQPGAGCDHSRDVGVVCTEPPPMKIRLAGGKNGNEGRVEVNIGGRWGTVCRPLFTDHAAQVVCGNLGLLGGRVILNRDVSFGPTRLPILLTNVRCSGSEMQLSGCGFSTATRGCTHRQDVGIRCERPPIVSLSIYNNTRQGYPLVNIANRPETSSICSTGFGAEEARVVCRQLGFQDGRAVSPPGKDPRDILAYPKLLQNVVCRGNEKDLSKCMYDLNSPCPGNRSAIVRCNEAPIQGIRLRGGTLQGLLEVKVKGRWGPVCDFKFGTNDAKVACKQLRHTGGSVLKYNGEWIQAVAGSFACKGDEVSLNDCEYFDAMQAYEEYQCYNSDSSGYPPAGPVVLRCKA